MMKLSALLRAAGVTAPIHSDVDITGVCIDSRKVEVGNLFLALKGSHEDGSRFVSDALAKGAAAVFHEGNFHPALEGTMERGPGAEIIPSENLRSRVGDLLNAWYGHPAAGMECVAVTGTNGKSTITKLAASLLRTSGRKVVSLGTINYEIDGDAVNADASNGAPASTLALPSELTTPGPDAFYAMLARGRDQGCTGLAMEMSSHALSQDRVKGVKFSRAIFTNLTQDHMDYHGDFEAYYQAKKRLFTEYLRPDALAILNLDSEHGMRLARELSVGKVTFSRGRVAADITLQGQLLTLTGTEFEVAYLGKRYRFTSRMIGAINLENLLAAVALGFSLGMDAAAIARGISDVTVTGRNQVFALPKGAFAVVDYAHTPDALERVLHSLRPLTPGILVCVFGCGGDRDRTKRPIMGGIAAASADRVVLTSDNPRSERPETILKEVMAGITDASRVRVVADRRAAIAGALDSLMPGDCLLIAGKGHEDYQIIGKSKLHFSDQEEIQAWMASRGSSTNVGRGSGSGHGN